MTHTPTPWTWRELGGSLKLVTERHGSRVILSGVGNMMTRNDKGFLEALTEDHEDIQFIATAVNSHDGLLEALEEYLDWHEANYVLPSGNFEDPDQQSLANAARVAIKKAKSCKT